METPQAPALHLLVPYDGSAQSSRAIDVAQALHPTKVILLRVVSDDYLAVPGTILNPDNEEFAPLLAELDGLAAPMREGGIDTETFVVFGDPAEEIIEAGTASDLIVMTTRGQGAASRALFGSVADRVSRHGTTPTLLIRSESGTPVVPRQRVVVPLDGSPRAAGALDIASKLARSLAVPLHLVRVVSLDDVRATIRAARREEPDAPAIGDTFDAAREAAESQALAYLQSVATPLQEAGFDVDTEILRGTPAFELLWNTKPEDLVVMTSHGHGGFRRWLLGSVAEKLVREGEAPLVLVPMRDPQD